MFPEMAQPSCEHCNGYGAIEKLSQKSSQENIVAVNVFLVFFGGKKVS